MIDRGEYIDAVAQPLPETGVLDFQVIPHNPEFLLKRNQPALVLAQ